MPPTPASSPSTLTQISNLPPNTAIDDLAFVAYPQQSQAIQRVVLFLHGRGERDLRTMLYPWEQRLVDHGSVFLYPYYGPWSWVTPQVSAYIDGLIDHVLAVSRQRNAQWYEQRNKQRSDQDGDGHSEAPPAIELIISGGSMGGHAALQHAIHTRHEFLRVFAVAPVTDLQACYESLPDVRRSMAVGLSGEAGSLPQILKRHSPQHCLDALPTKPLMIFHGTEDEMVPIKDHSDRYCAALSQRSHPLSYHRLKMGHEAVERFGGHDWVRHYFLCEGRTDLSPEQAKDLSLQQGLPQQAVIPDHE